MNEFKKGIQKDAKSDWMSLVNKHKKKQKGLPALSTLNTNAGNVEYNIEMFNMMQPSSSMSVDAASGNVFADGAVMSESLESGNLPEKVELEYTKLPVEVVVNYKPPYYSTSFGNWLPDEYDTVTRKIDWVYEADTDSVIDFLMSLSDVVEKLNAEDMSDEEFGEAIAEHFDDLLTEFNSDLLKWFEEDAIADAEDNFQESLEVEDGSCDKQPLVENSTVDDVFDLSMRTLL